MQRLFSSLVAVYRTVIGCVWLASVVWSGALAVDIHQVGSYSRSGGNVLKVIGLGRYALVAEQGYSLGTNYVRGSLRALDLSDPHKPKSLFRYETGYILDFAASGTNVFVLTQQEGLHILNASDPTNLQRSGSLPFSTSAGDEAALAFSNEHVYLIHYLQSNTRPISKLSIIDVRDPANPRRVHDPGITWQTWPSVRPVPGGNHVFAIQGDRIHVLEITNPSTPRRVAVFSSPSSIWGAAYSNGNLYLAEAPYYTNGGYQGGGVSVVDVSRPEQPKAIGNFVIGRSPAGLAVQGNYAYLLERESSVRIGGIPEQIITGGRLRVIDFSAPAASKQVGVYETRGVYTSVAVDGDRAFLNNEEAFALLDISDPANPAVLGGEAFRSNVKHVVLRDQYAYVADANAGLEVLDLSAGSTPRLAGSSFIGTPANTVSVAGNLACVSALGGLHFIDISDPSHPRKRGEWLTKGNVMGMSMRSNYAFVATVPTVLGGGGLHILEISDISSPRMAATYGTSATSVIVSNNFAYVSVGVIEEGTNMVEAGLHIVDISKPASPKRIAIYPSPAYDLSLVGNYLYLAGGSLEILDLRNPTSSARVAMDGSSNGFPKRLAISGGVALLTEIRSVCIFHAGCYVAAALRAIDIENPVKPRPLGSYMLSDFDPGPDYGAAELMPLGVASNGGLIYFAAGNSGLHVLRRTVSNPQRAGMYRGDGAAVATTSAATVTAVAESEWDAEEGRTTNRIQILDLAYPSSPRALATCEVAWPIVAVALATNAVFALEAVPDTESTLLELIDFRHPSSPIRKGSYRTRGQPVGLAISGNDAYVGVGAYLSGDLQIPGELQILDIFNAGGIMKVGTYYTAENLRGLSVRGNRAYLIEGDLSLSIIDVTSRSDPKLLGYYIAPGYLVDLAISGNHAYLVQQPRWTGSEQIDGALLVVDIANPVNPTLIATYPTSGQVLNGVAVSGDYAYFLEGDRFQSTLHIIDMTYPAKPRRAGGRTLPSVLSTLSAHGNKLFLLAGDEGLMILHEYRPIRLESISFRSNREVQMRIVGPPGVPGFLQSSADLKSWEDVMSISFGESAVDFSSASSGFARFYRVTTEQR